MSPEVPNPKNPANFFSASRIPAALLIIIILAILIPAACMGIPAAESSGNAGDISLDISFPHEGETCYIDVVPPHVVVTGVVEGVYALKSVAITIGADTVTCENSKQIACTIPVSPGNNQITITAIDDRGNMVTETRNLTVRIGLPPPAEISISGRVLDPSGNPVPGASVLAESVLDLDGRPLSVNTTTADDGSYTLRNAVSYVQTITITKVGYSVYRQKITFEKTDNRYDVTLSPNVTPAMPGFDLLTSLGAVCGALCIVC